MSLAKKLLVLASFTCIGMVSTAQAAMISFNYTGGVQQWVVPVNVTSIDIRAWGAQGQSNAGGVVGGLGGFVSGTLAVTAGDILNIFIGGGGLVSTSGGWNGGGNAGSGAAAALGGGGGGATDVRIGGLSLLARVLVAAGGGGAGGNRGHGLGRGTGGGGGAGYYGGGGGAAWPFGSVTLPSGGSQVAGGSGGTSTYNSAPNNDGGAGSLGSGGNGGNEISSNQGGNGTAQTGGAGGGLIGGAGQYLVNWTGQSGAGGSSYIDLLSASSTIAGVRSGNGLLEIDYEVRDAKPVSAPPSLFLLVLASWMFFIKRSCP